MNRFCASSLQTIRMAFHAIRAGEGDAYVAAGVESITQVDGYPKDAEELHPETVRRRRADRERLHPDGADCRERGRALGRLARGHGPLRTAVAGTRGRGPRTQASSLVRSRPGTESRRTTVPRPESTLEKLAAAGARVQAGREGHRRELLPAQRRRRRCGRHERRPAHGSSGSSRGHGSSHPQSRVWRRRSWASARSAPCAACSGRRE